MYNNENMFIQILSLNLEEGEIRSMCFHDSFSQLRIFSLVDLRIVAYNLTSTTLE